jgi:hypothetical protein
VAGIAMLWTTPRTRFEQLAQIGPMNAAATYSSAHPDEKIMAPDITASALLWTHPTMAGRVGFDARYEIYTQDQLEAYTDWIAGTQGRPRWSRVLAGYDIVVASTLLRQNVIDRMRTLPGWRQIYADADGAVFVRDGA